MLAGSFISAAIAIGFTSYIYGMFTVPVTEELGLSRANYNNGFIALSVGIALFSPFTGRLLDQFSPRLLVAFAGTLFGCSIATISILKSPIMMLLLLLLPIAAGVSTCGALGANTITVKWFQSRRGLALGILALSTSVGGLLSQPFTGWLITNLGWRHTLLIIGILCFFVFLFLSMFLIKDKPDPSIYKYEDEFDSNVDSKVSAKESTAEPRAITEPTFSYVDILRTKNFWLLTCAIGIFFGVDQSILVSQVPYFLDRGYTLEIAATLVSIKTLSAIGGKLIVGFLADKVDLRSLFTAVALCNISLMSIYILQPSFWILVLFLSLLGVAVGGVFPVWTTSVAWLFGSRSYGTAMGMTAIGTQIFTMLNIRFVGEVYDRTGTYKIAFVVFIGMVAIAILLFRSITPPAKN
ncbi:MFS transporter [Halioxenophilus aromaticivorans]|uniref:MFS transporter n=1 Tax=Halioxenophilus aromaticivorans TaxID=1306992 RepID=A0AAV3U514_9ALTE